MENTHKIIYIPFLLPIEDRLCFREALLDAHKNSAVQNVTRQFSAAKMSPNYFKDA